MNFLENCPSKYCFDVEFEWVLTETVARCGEQPQGAATEGSKYCAPDYVNDRDVIIFPFSNTM